MVNKYDQKHKEIIQKEARERYQKLPGEERYKRRRKAQERYKKFYRRRKRKMASVPADLVTFSGEILSGKPHFLCSERKQKLPEYRRYYYLTHKKTNLVTF